MTSSVTGRNRRFGQSAHLMRGFSHTPRTHSLAQARSRRDLSCGFRIASGTHPLDLGRALEIGRSSLGATMPGRQCPAWGPCAYSRPAIGETGHLSEVARHRDRALSACKEELEPISQQQRLGVAYV
jgi:hypothetical protein